MKGLVGGLGPGHLAPLKSGPANVHVLSYQTFCV